jgi:hypothetical protein
MVDAGSIFLGVGGECRGDSDYATTRVDIRCCNLIPDSGCVVITFYGVAVDQLVLQVRGNSSTPFSTEAFRLVAHIYPTHVVFGEQTGFIVKVSGVKGDKLAI